MSANPETTEMPTELQIKVELQPTLSMPEVVNLSQLAAAEGMTLKEWIVTYLKGASQRTKLAGLTGSGTAVVPVTRTA